MHYENHVQKDASPMNGPKELTVKLREYSKMTLARICFKVHLLVVVLMATCFPSSASALSWPGNVGLLGEEAVQCLAISPEDEHQVTDRLGTDDAYTTACRVTESIVMLWAERGGNADSLGVLDLKRNGSPIELGRGLPWIEKTLRDKAGVLHIVAGNGTLRDGNWDAILSLYSTTTWSRIDLARRSGPDSNFMVCPEAGEYNYSFTPKLVQESHRYEDRNRDGFEDIIIETVETSCLTHESKASTAVFLATMQGFKKATPSKTSRKKPVRPKS